MKKFLYFMLFIFTLLFLGYMAVSTIMMTGMIIWNIFPMLSTQIACVIGGVVFFSLLTGLFAVFIAIE